VRFDFRKEVGVMFPAPVLCLALLALSRPASVAPTDETDFTLWRAPSVSDAPPAVMRQFDRTLPTSRSAPSSDEFILVAQLPIGESNIWEGDMDHDGKKELWYAHSLLGPVSVYEVIGDNAFTLVHTAPAPTDYSWFLGIGDTDGDGLEEIIWKAGYYADPFLVFYEQPDPHTFPSTATAEHHTGVVNTHYTHLRVFDTDGDQLREVICSHQGTSERSVAVYEATGDDVYDEICFADWGPSSSVSGCVGVGDFDGDGRREIAAPEVSDQVRVHIIEAQADNTFSETWTSQSFADPNGYWVTEGGDLDRDGLGDFVLITGRGGFIEPVVWTAWMFETTGDDTFQVAWSYEHTSPDAMGFDGGAVSGDADGDGQAELLFQAASGLTVLFRATADDTLQPLWSLEGPVREQGRRRLISSDLDLDGEPELVWYTDTHLVIYEHVSAECPADFDGDGDVDTADLLYLLAAWGTPDGDVDGDNDTDTADLLALLAAWGDCP
jgi:hypothetical protein